MMPQFLYISMIIVKRFEGDDQTPIPSITFQKKILGKFCQNTVKSKSLHTVTNKPYVNEVTLTGQNQLLKFC